jgi:hypothetical protein
MMISSMLQFIAKVHDEVQQLVEEPPVEIGEDAEPGKCGYPEERASKQPFLQRKGWHFTYLEAFGAAPMPALVAA